MEYVMRNKRIIKCTYILNILNRSLYVHRIFLIVQDNGSRQGRWYINSYGHYRKIEHPNAIPWMQIDTGLQVNPFQGQHG